MATMRLPEHCLRCAGRLERGFTVDQGDMQMLLSAFWASGEPQVGFWRTSVVGKGSRKLPMTSLRCTRCGLLETYALDP